jgi:hypothetical protein
MAFNSPWNGTHRMPDKSSWQEANAEWGPGRKMQNYVSVKGAQNSGQEKQDERWSKAGHAHHPRKLAFTFFGP